MGAAPPRKGRNKRIAGRMGRIIKGLLVLAVLGFLALVAYAYLGNLAPQQSPVTKPVVLDGQ